MTLPRLVVLLASAGLHAFAFAPWHAWPLAGLAVAPFLVCVYRLRPATAALAGLLWGCAAIWALAAWVAPAISFYYEQPWWFGLLFCAVGCAILWGAHYALFAAAASWLAGRIHPPVRPLLISALWVACEFLRARLVTGEPWMQLGYALADVPLLAQAADLGSVPLLSFVVILVNASLAEVWVADAGPVSSRVAIAPAAALAVLASYGAHRLAVPLDAGPSVPVTVVQGNNDLHRQWRSEFYGDGLERYLRLSRPEAFGRSGLMVWPESAVTFFLAEEPAYRSRIARVLDAADVQLVVGGPYREADDVGDLRFFNAAFLLAEDGAVQSRYDKERLLPFAEYFPMRFGGFLRRHFEQVRNFVPGDGRTLLSTRAGRAAVVICFEAIFPELVRERMRQGAEILLNLSNDVWLGAGAGPEQHLQMVTLRAIEARTWVVRATTTGVSAVIDPYGRVRERAAVGSPAVLRSLVSPLRVDTLYERFGDVFAYACLAVTAGALLALAATTGRGRT